MIRDYGKQKYGIDLSDQDAQTIMNASGGGDPGRLDQAFMMRPDVQSKMAFDNAKKAQQMQIEANQPAIQRLTTQQSDLDKRYDELITSIKGTQEYETGQADIASKQGLAARNIDPNSELGLQLLNKGRLPVSTSFGSLLAQTGLQEEQELAQLAELIAQYEVGNVPNALNFASNIGNQLLQSQQIQNQLELGRESNALKRQQLEQAAKGGGNENRYLTLGEGQTIYDLLNNIPLYTTPKTYAPKTGSTDSGW